ncbi:hypothetical protein AFLA_012337 [Aspergillus flavus NRRL3357]|nr:hypothetical protein AFLA_012337 [Aspergillus flavus NRRL3357]
MSSFLFREVSLEFEAKAVKLSGKVALFRMVMSYRVVTRKETTKPGRKNREDPHCWSFAHSINDLQQVQVESLTSFYLLSIGQVNRSWRFCGLSMRSAITTGIHLRNESPDVSLTSRKNLCWVWWSLYTLDITLCLKTGRGPSVNTDFITTPLPLPFGDNAMWEHGQNPEVSGTSIIVHDGLQTSPEGSCGPILDTSRYCLSFVQLTLLMRQSIESLYAPACSKVPWNVR